MANFSANTQQGCAPLSVTFTDLSTGSPKFWNWDLGNGQLSSEQNPSTTYNNPGRYTITLVVRNADGTNGVTRRDYITVGASPTANFGSNVNVACSPATIQFGDASVANTGTIAKWEWDFGDGTTSSLQNPQKSYTAAGFYSITLKVTNSSGCVNQVTKHRFVRILNGVKAAFADSLNRACQAPFVTTFINQTSGPGTLSYAWDLGNGTTSTLTSPKASFATAGTYNIQLIARSDLGCSDSIRKTITINNAASNFTSPDTACINTPVSFQNASAPAPVRASWDFGDATRSQQLSPVKTFTAVGTYQVKLVNTYAACTDSITKQITIVNAATIDFTATNREACKAPFTVAFQDLSPNTVSWQWDFGDGSSSTQKDPSHVYTRAGEFDVTLTVTNASGCKNTLRKPKFISIVAPTVSITPAGGCIPFTYSPVAAIKSLDPVTSYLWDFGDGGATSNSPTPSHVYANTGNFTVRLTITTAGGCTATVSVPNGVRTGTRPTVNFTANKLTNCAFDTVRFTNTSNPSDAWLWRFGDGSDTLARDPSHLFKDTGRFTITLVAFNNGCADSLSRTEYIHVLPPVALYRDSVDCGNRLRRFFTSVSMTDAAYGPVSYLWRFGDPANSTSTLANPEFPYPAFGTYSVSLTVTNGSCSNTITKNILVSEEKADFSLPRGSICKKERILLTATSSNPENISQYIYSINGGPPIIGSQSTPFVFDSTGAYTVRLVIIDRYGCSDTITKVVTIEGPTAAFALTGSSCKSKAVTFNDLSTSGTPIAKWEFDFGDGTVQSFTRPPFTHLYKDTGTFAVRLRVTDQSNCSDEITISDAVIITNPAAGFTAENTTFCPGVPLQFLDSSRGKGLRYAWDFGDGGRSTDKDPVHVYAGGDNVYSVKLVIADTAGCLDSSTRVNYIQVRTPKPAFDSKDTVSICAPFESGFVFKGRDHESFLWDFGDSSTSTLEDPVHFYNDYGVYVAKLYVIGYGGCVDSSQQVITVHDPVDTDISYNPLTACNSLLVDFTVSNTVTPFLFYFGDRDSDDDQRKSFQHLYSGPGSYYPSLVLTDKSGCEVEISGKNEIRILGAEPFFSPDRKAMCDSGTVYFTNYTLGNDPIISSVWDFGDGVTSSDKDPIHNYDKPGRYIASLSVNTLNGCSKTLYDTIRVYSTPNPVISGNDAVCINIPLQLNGASSQGDTALTWRWTFSNGQTSTQQNPSVVFNRLGRESISLEATNPLGCKRSVTKNLVVNGIPTITKLADPVIAIGTGVNLPLSYSANIATYTWTPSRDLSCTNCPNPLASPKLTTRYTVNVVDTNGCQNSESITVNVVCNDKNYFIPNTFTPNGDGSNDVFFPRGSNIDRIQSMRIFSRSGEMVFERRNFPANSASDGWNGFYKGKQAPSDAYVYVIEFICENSTIIPYKGNITLIR